MILDALPRNTARPFEMAPNTLRWELGKSQLPEALPRIEKAFGENEFVEDFTLEHGQLSGTQFFIQVVYTRVNNT